MLKANINDVFRLPQSMTIAQVKQEYCKAANLETSTNVALSNEDGALDGMLCQ
jgi:hypothetical protein